MRNKIHDLLNTLHRHHVMARALSMLLSLLLIFYAVPTIIYAEAIEAIGDSVQAEEPLSDLIKTTEEEDSEGIDIYTYRGVAYEARELREESAEHFKLEDGSTKLTFSLIGATRQPFKDPWTEEDGYIKYIFR